VKGQSSLHIALYLHSCGGLQRFITSATSGVARKTAARLLRRSRQRLVITILPEWEIALSKSRETPQVA
jgi:hypothetical protein